MSNKFETDLQRPPNFAENNRVLNLGEQASRGAALLLSRRKYSGTDLGSKRD